MFPAAVSDSWEIDSLPNWHSHLILIQIAYASTSSWVVFPNLWISKIAVEWNDLNNVVLSADEIHTSWYLLFWKLGIYSLWEARRGIITSVKRVFCTLKCDFSVFLSLVYLVSIIEFTLFLHLIICRMVRLKIRCCLIFVWHKIAFATNVSSKMK